MVKLHVAVFPVASVDVQVVVVVPAGKNEPEGGAHTVVNPGQLSVDVGAA
jgi:hypothetical protein